MLPLTKSEIMLNALFSLAAIERMTLSFQKNFFKSHSRSGKKLDRTGSSLHEEACLSNPFFHPIHPIVVKGGWNMIPNLQQITPRQLLNCFSSIKGCIWFADFRKRFCMSGQEVPSEFLWSEEPLGNDSFVFSLYF